jgi:hypothetical protein
MDVEIHIVGGAPHVRVHDVDGNQHLRRYCRPMSTTKGDAHIRPPRRRVYEALLDADSVQQWIVPDGDLSCALVPIHTRVALFGSR